jgi:hypothetical protein
VNFSRVTKLARRLCGTTTLLLHVGVAVAAPLADALFEARSGEPVVHVESESRESCPPAHDHLVCPVCRLLQARFAGTSAPPRHLPQQVLAFHERFAEETSEAGPLFRGVLGARAPPLL